MGAARIPYSRRTSFLAIDLSFWTLTSHLAFEGSDCTSRSYGRHLGHWRCYLLGSRPEGRCWASTQGGALHVELSERVSSHNTSMGPWESTGCAPQGWASHLQQFYVPIQGYIQLQASASATLPAFGGGHCTSEAGAPDSSGSCTAAPTAEGLTCLVGIFARAPVCDHMCTSCQRRPCAIIAIHDVHTCYDCANGSRDAGVPAQRSFVAPLHLPGCERMCSRCCRQTCCLKYVHEHHACYWCSLAP